jgi:hypothetical protein
VYRIRRESGSRDSLVGIVARVDDPGLDSRAEQETLSKTPLRAAGPTKSPVKWVPAVSQMGRGPDHSPPCSVEVRNEWSYTSPPPISVHDVQRNRFILLLPLRR